MQQHNLALNTAFNFDLSEINTLIGDSRGSLKNYWKVMSCMDLFLITTDSMADLLLIDLNCEVFAYRFSFAI